jgi:hypothetical protein
MPLSQLDFRQSVGDGIHFGHVRSDPFDRLYRRLTGHRVPDERTAPEPVTFTFAQVRSPRRVADPSAGCDPYADGGRVPPRSARERKKGLESPDDNPASQEKPKRTATSGLPDLAGRRRYFEVISHLPRDLLDPGFGGAVPRTCRWLFDRIRRSSAIRERRVRRAIPRHSKSDDEDR